MITKDDRNQKIKEIIREALSVVFEAMFPGKMMKAPAKLWHYTTADALESILKTKTIYATQFSYLNDPSEIELFAKIAQQIADQKLKDVPLLQDDQVIETHKQYKTVMWKIIKEYKQILIFEPICVTCFSEVDDLLGQWRAYANNCKGYSIGLSTQWLKTQATSKEYPFRLLKVIYQYEEQIKIISKILDLVVDKTAFLLSEIEEKDSKETLDLTIDLIKGLAAEISPIIKHPAYAEEREWRLLSFGIPLDVRSSNGNFVQFKTINLNDATSGHPFREIKIGPGNDPKIETPALKLLVEKLGFKNEIQISSSIIPLKVT